MYHVKGIAWSDSSFPLLLQKLENLEKWEPIFQSRKSQWIFDWLEKSANFTKDSGKAREFYTEIIPVFLWLDDGNGQAHTLVTVIYLGEKKNKKTWKVREICQWQYIVTLWLHKKIPHGSVIIFKDNVKHPSVFCKKLNCHYFQSNSKAWTCHCMSLKKCLSHV